MILKTYVIDKVLHLLTPEENYEITLNSPALDILTDFKKTEPLIIDDSLNVIEAEDFMKKTHVKLMLVFSENEFSGTVAYSDLIGEKIIKFSHHTPRNQILVRDIMVSKNWLRAISYEDLKQARIKDVVETLKNEGKQHFLVIDDAKQSIRGIFSVSDIARRLHIPININQVTTFIDIYKALNHESYD